MQINEYFTHMFPGHEGPILEGDDNDWPLSSECGICCTEICIAASRYIDLLDPAVDSTPVINTCFEQCQVICYG